jgi:hypothetical protein
VQSAKEQAERIAKEQGKVAGDKAAREAIEEEKRQQGRKKVEAKA